MIVWAHHADDGPNYQAITRYISDKIWGDGRQFTLGTAMAVLRDDVLLGCAVFHNYDKDAGVIEISAGAESPRWLSRQVLAAMFGYVFNSLGCQAVVTRCDPDSARLRRIMTTYGFEEHRLPRMRGRDKDDALYILTDDAWRGNKFNRKAHHGFQST